MSDRESNVVIIGLGYVGLTLGVALAQRGLMVFGIERRADVVALTNAGTPHFSEVGLASALTSVVDAGQFIASTDLAQVPPSSYYIITVGTPLRAGTHEPRLDMIEQASAQVAGHLTDGAVVILRSTVRIGTTRNVVLPVLEKSHRSFHLAMCPERTLEGDALRELTTLPQIVGGMTDAASEKAAALFSRLTQTTVCVGPPETAEMIKLVDNTSRDVRFAFANEVARACDAIGINANDVIQFGKLGYSRTDVASPGLVGGPCLEKDPHILLASVAPVGVHLEITAASRLINERQPAETVSAAVGLLARQKPGPYRVAIAGLAFKGRPETDDLRGSMGLKVLDQLFADPRIAEINAHDPVIPVATLRTELAGVTVFSDVYAAADQVDLLVITNNHPFYGTLDPVRLRAVMADGGVIYDYWNSLGQHPAAMLRDRYYTVGNLIGTY